MIKMSEEKVKRIIDMLTIVLGFMLMTFVFLVYDLIDKLGKYGWYYNSTYIINNEIISNTVQLKDNLIFISLYLFILILLFLSMTMIKKIRD